MTPDDQLRDIDDLAACLPELVTARRADAGGSSSPGPRVPLRLDVLAVLDDRERVHGDDAEDRAWHDRMAGDHRQGLLPDLWQWARLIEAEAMDTCPEIPEEIPDDMPGLPEVIAWLHRHLPWALTQPWSGELTGDIDWWWRRVKDIAGEAVRDPYRPRCRWCMFPVDPEGSGLWRCCGCGRTEVNINVELERLGERPVTINEATRLVDRTRPTIKTWIRDGRLRPANPGQRPTLVRVSDLRRVDRETPRRTGSS